MLSYILYSGGGALNTVVDLLVVVFFIVFLIWLIRRFI